MGAKCEKEISLANEECHTCSQREGCKQDCDPDLAADEEQCLARLALLNSRKHNMCNVYCPENRRSLEEDKCENAISLANEECHTCSQRDGCKHKCNPDLAAD